MEMFARIVWNIALNVPIRNNVSLVKMDIKRINSFSVLNNANFLV